MNAPRRSGPSPTNPVGDGHTLRPSWGYLFIALGLVAGGLIFLWNLSSEALDVTVATKPVTMTVPESGATAATAVWPPAFPAATPEVSQHAPEGDADPTRDLSSYLMRGEKATMPEVIERLHQAGIHTGLGAFSPPGTRPPMIGLAVPEDFVLPAGYVRHHQATDDGQRIEAILMFAPDHQFFDAAKQPIIIPKDRIVPPELAPAGFPIRRIVLPAPAEAGRS